MAKVKKNKTKLVTSSARKNEEKLERLHIARGTTTWRSRSGQVKRTLTTYPWMPTLPVICPRKMKTLFTQKY